MCISPFMQVCLIEELKHYKVDYICTVYIVQISFALLVMKISSLKHGVH